MGPHRQLFCYKDGAAAVYPTNLKQAYATGVFEADYAVMLGQSLQHYSMKYGADGVVDTITRTVYAP